MNNGFVDKVGGGFVPDEVAARADRDRIIAALGDPVRSIITQDGWKYNYSPELGEHELYDLNADPNEVTNLAARPEHKDRIAGLRQRICAWQERTGDKPATACPRSARPPGGEQGGCDGGAE